MEHVMNLIYHIREEIKIKRKIEKIQGVSELTICKRRLKTSVKFPSKPEQKTYTHFFSIIGPLIPPVFAGDFVPHTPHKGLHPQALDERQSIQTQFNWCSCTTV